MVNLAARFMQAAGKDGSVLCDAATALAVTEHGIRDLRFERLPKMKVKGKADPLLVYAPRLDPERDYSPAKNMSPAVLSILVSSALMLR